MKKIAQRIALKVSFRVKVKSLSCLGSSPVFSLRFLFDLLAGESGTPFLIKYRYEDSDFE